MHVVLKGIVHPEYFFFAENENAMGAVEWESKELKKHHNNPKVIDNNFLHP